MPLLWPRTTREETQARRLAEEEAQRLRRQLADAVASNAAKDGLITRLGVDLARARTQQNLEGRSPPR